MRSDESCTTRDQNFLCHDCLTRERCKSIVGSLDCKCRAAPRRSSNRTWLAQRLYLWVKLTSHVSENSLCRARSRNVVQLVTDLVSFALGRSSSFRTLSRSDER